MTAKITVLAGLAVLVSGHAQIHFDTATFVPKSDAIYPVLSNYCVAFGKNLESGGTVGVARSDAPFSDSSVCFHFMVGAAAPRSEGTSCS
jgi:hypothetical protein